MKKRVRFTVTDGEPFKNFRETNFFVTKSIIDPQSRNDSNHPTIASAERFAKAWARKVNGKITKTTIEEISLTKPKKVMATK